MIQPAAGGVDDRGLGADPGPAELAVGSELGADRARLVEEHLGLARYLARRFLNRGEHHDDLVQVASLALVKAAGRFDPDLGVTFATFATTSIIGELRRHFRDHARSIRLPRRLQETGAEIALAVETLSQTLGRSPSIGEVAAACGRDESEVIEAMEADRCARPASLDQSVRQASDPSDEPLAARVADESDVLTRVDGLLSLSPHLQRLRRDEQYVLHLRFVEDLTQTEIANRTGLSQMGVSRLLARSLASLRESFGAGDE